MQRLAFVSDLQLKPSGGGTYSVSWQTYQQLLRSFTIENLAPVQPRIAKWDAFVSKLRRKVLKRPSCFHYFSPTTLDSNAQQIEQRLPEDCDGIFFRSAARWCRCRPKVPYFIHLDIVFHTFFHNTFQSDDFFSEDLQRIYAEEAEFINGAAGVFFESPWGMQLARDVYDLENAKLAVAGVGGVIQPPEADTWNADEPPKLISIAMNFRQKGGDITLEAFKCLKQRYPDLQWHIIGGPPEGPWQDQDGIHYEGFLNPSNPEELKRFRKLLGEAFLLVHPTREDANPLVLIEAAYFGCPTISVRRFAIPHLVLDGTTGLLVDWPAEAESIAEAIAGVLDAPDRYQEMRRQARQRALAEFDWQTIGDRVNGAITEALN